MQQDSSLTISGMHPSGVSHTSRVTHFNTCIMCMRLVCIKDHHAHLRTIHMTVMLPLIGRRHICA